MAAKTTERVTKCWTPELQAKKIELGGEDDVVVTGARDGRDAFLVECKDGAPTHPRHVLTGTLIYAACGLKHV